MGNHSVSYQSPRPEVVIYRPDKKGKPLRFDDTSNRTVLQSYSFGTSINDEKGRFSLTFYPDDEKLQFKEDAIFDQIHPMDIVEIYESQNHFNQKSGGVNLYGDEVKYKEVMPTFTGVIREKKFTAAKTGNGVSRKIVVSGCSVAGLVHEFKISIDTTAYAITAQSVETNNVRGELSKKFVYNNNEPLKLGFVIKEIWKSYINLSKESTNKISNPKVIEFIKEWIGDDDDLFCVDDTVLQYPIADIFNGENLHTFFEIISGLIPKPVYEIFPFTDKGDEKDDYKNAGKMRLMIREVPFDTDAGNDTWGKLPCTPIDAKLVKSFDLKQSDSEVYTVFYSYLRGSALQEDLAIRIAAQKGVGAPEIMVDDPKYGIYGYRPLFVTLNGYGTADGTTDDKCGDRLKKLNERLRSWYSNMDKMFSGSITMETDLSTYMPQAGEKISFLGDKNTKAEFYVVDSEHSWNYGGAPETKISISRGGDYSSGSFSELKDMAKRYQEFKKNQETDNKTLIFRR
jgi:hypothetical protein